VHEAFKRINGLMPEVLENGSRQMQLEANVIMGKVLLKMGSLKLEGKRQSEESKIAGESHESVMAG